ncbi:hypothetical protein ZWY2020_054728 [Hordeum vulgare]|nr:hypothetical protein ZWY2020_054728 [Hordeum vulgare]
MSRPVDLAAPPADDDDLIRVLGSIERDGKLPPWVSKRDLYTDVPEVVTATCQAVPGGDGRPVFYVLTGLRSMGGHDLHVSRTAGPGYWRIDKTHAIWPTAGEAGSSSSGGAPLGTSSALAFFLRAPGGAETRNGWLMKELVLRHRRGQAAGFQEWGLGKGWGENAERCKETLNFLSEVLQATDPINMEKFFGRVPSIFNIVVFSIHGYFGQEKVLGLPDTGVQVVYILDQVRSMEEELVQRIKQQGLHITPKSLVLTRLIPDSKGTKCNVELEPVENTKYSNILRVPFKTEDEKDFHQWVSWFDIYPYLERYTQDASAKILDILEGKPDLIIGNYTNGNLVASLMSSKLGVTQVGND